MNTRGTKVGPRDRSADELRRMAKAITEQAKLDHEHADRILARGGPNMITNAYAPRVVANALDHWAAKMRRRATRLERAARKVGGR